MPEFFTLHEYFLPISDRYHGNIYIETNIFDSSVNENL